MKQVILTLLLVLVFCNVVSGYETEVSWIHGDSPAEYSLPEPQNTSDLVYFSVNLDFKGVYRNQWFAEDDLGGSPTLTINPVDKEIMLEFQGSPSVPYSNNYNPVCGLSGYFGPLEEGQWTFVFRFEGFILWDSFDVIPGDVRAGYPYPDDGAFNVSQSLVLRWRSGYGAVRHDIYFGQNPVAVANATRTSSIYRGQQAAGVTSFDPGLLNWDTDYYWRIDEVEADGQINVGDVWSFTTAGFIVNDDFESFTDEPGNRIFDIWAEEGNATVGYAQAPYVDRKIVFCGEQSMPLTYSNTEVIPYSAARRTLDTSQDWTAEGIDFLVLYVHGRPSNDSDQLYVEIEDSAGRYARVFNSNQNILRRDEWTPWRIPLSDFTGDIPPGIEEIDVPGSINLRQVTSISIGIGRPPDNGGGIDGLRNDYCFDAIPISGNVTNRRFDTTDCQYDGPEPEICMDSPNIWYCYTAQRTCNVTVSLCGSSYDTMLSIYDGCGCPPRRSDLMACNDDACGQQSEITFFAFAGNKYMIEVGGWTETSWGPGVLNIRCEGESLNKVQINDAEFLADATEGTVNIDPVITVGTQFGVLRGTVTSTITGFTIQNPVFKLTPDFPEWIAPDGSYVIFLLQPTDFTVELTAAGYVMQDEDRKVKCHMWDVEKHFKMYLQ